MIPTPEGGSSDDWRQAVELFHQAIALQFQGRLPEAIETYRRSIATYPTAEAHTYLGWTHSWMENYDLAMSEAKKAIDLDPDYGKPLQRYRFHPNAKGAVG